jgi:Cof subfamily protein (haloacid dehalogenase superfamily)
MKEKQIVFFDIDGTLLTSELKVAGSSIEAIQAIKKQGVEPVIATGRTFSEIDYILEATGIRSYVVMNGQYVVYEGDLIYENPFDQNKVKALHITTEHNGHELAFYSAGAIVVTANDSELIAKNYQRIGGAYPHVDSSIYLSQSIHLMLLFCKEGEEEYYQEHFPYFQFVRNSPFGCDVYPAGTSKATGIKRLLSHQNLSLELTYAFGDGLNDIEMFQLVKNPVAMGNAVDEIKQMAKYVTTSNNEDGISHGLRLCGLLSK